MSQAKFTYAIYGETNQGMVRQNNEDTFICQTIWDDDHILCAAIDGLGGYEGGEIAAEIARKGIIGHLEDFATIKPGQLLKNALIEVNNEIESQHRARPKASQMGCVASVALFDIEKNIMYLAHCGDSRIYEFSNSVLKKLTHDHSLVGYREEAGEMSEEAAMNHPKRNVIDRYLGEQHLPIDTEGYIEVSAYPLSNQGQYLFCSDGLTDLITSSQIISVLKSSDSVKKKTRKLIDMANKAGGKDNVTVVIVDLKSKHNPKSETKTEDRKPEEHETAHLRKTNVLMNLLFLITGILVGAGITYLSSYYEDTRVEDKATLIISDLSNENKQLIDSISSLNAVIAGMNKTLKQTTVNTDTDDTQESDSSL